MVANDVEVIARFTPAAVAPGAEVRERGLQRIRSGRTVLVERHQALWQEQYRLGPDGLAVAGEDGFAIPVAPRVLTVAEGLGKIQAVAWGERTLQHTASPHRVPPRHGWNGSGRDQNRFYDREDAMRYLADTDPYRYEAGHAAFLDAGWWLHPDFAAVVAEEGERKERERREREAAAVAAADRVERERRERGEATTRAQALARGLRFEKSSFPAPHPGNRDETAEIERLTTGRWNIEYGRDEKGAPLAPTLTVCVEGRYYVVARTDTIADAKRWVALLLRSRLPWGDATNHRDWPEEQRRTLIRWHHAVAAGDFRDVPEGPEGSEGPSPCGGGPGAGQ